MKKFIITLIYSCSILFSANASAIHGNPYYSGTFDFCQPGLCDVYGSINSGSSISANLFFELLEPFPDLGNIVDYNITIDGSAGSIVLDNTNTFILTNTATAYADEFEVTTISGGIFSLDTSEAFAETLGIPSELVFDFDNDRIDFYAFGNELTASTSPVPLPSALILLLSGLIPLLSFAQKRKRT